VSEPQSTDDRVTLSIIIATTGRPTLAAAVESATSQMLPGDELVVVFDDSGDAGDTPRNRVIPMLRTTHISFLDDDDEYRPGALQVIRDFARKYPGRVGIFRRDMGMWGVAWAERDLMASATGMYVVPNLPDKLGRFGHPPGVPEGRVGDYTFIVETVANLGDPIWREEITQNIRPVKGLRGVRYRLALGRKVKRAIGLSAPEPRGAAPAHAEARAWADEHLAGRERR
jgi:glycosyltransferase involved in cell wall biosynthesis